MDKSRAMFSLGSNLRVSKAIANPLRHGRARLLSTTRARQVVKPFLLADVGEGIREVQIIQWFVKPGARVEQFDKICECQSDKASVEITSRFDGIIKKLHYEPDDMAQVGKPLLDIDIQSEISPEDEKLTSVGDDGSSKPEPQPEPAKAENSAEGSSQSQEPSTATKESEQTSKTSRHQTLATPAVRHLTKELNVNIEDVTGSGKDGRVLKEDVRRFAALRDSGNNSAAPSPVKHQSSTEEDRTVSLTPIQSQMFKTMTRSLAIPHFMYSDSVDTSRLTTIRTALNEKKSDKPKISALSMILKAVSLALRHYPILNARVDLSDGESKPKLLYRGSHNLGIAVDTPSGLLVPVVRSVEALSIAEIASEISRLASTGRENKLTSSDLSGGTFSVSNVGSIGGGAVAPVIVDSQVAIVGVGRARTVPAFDDEGDLIRREECVLSWSADHRVVDGATVARCAELVRRYIENPEEMLALLR